MIEVLTLVMALSAGALLGVLFFGGLWWTVRRGIVSANPALFFLGSLLLRTVVVVAGLYFVSRGDWRRLVASLAGFLLARVLVGRRVDSAVHAHPQVLAERTR
jgi:F1F0 ATPase subunit 2